MHAKHQAQNLFLSGPAGKVEAVLWTPAGVSQKLAALVCHPHPLFGGTLHNKVVYHAAKALDALGLAVLRFNFRGAGLSEGHHEKGLGEVGDVRCALDFLGEQFPGTPLLVAGFSFGCWVGLRAGCRDPRVTLLIGLGAPVDSSDFSYLLQCSKPKLFLHGENDEFGSIAKLRELVRTLPGENELIVVNGVDHFFSGELARVGQAITEWLRPALADEIPGR